MYIYIIYIYKHYVGLNGQAQLLKKSMCLLLSNMIACLLFFAYDLRCPNLNGTTKMWSVSPDQRPKIPPKKERNWNSSPFATIFFQGSGGCSFLGRVWLLDLEGFHSTELSSLRSWPLWEQNDSHPRVMGLNGSPITREESVWWELLKPTAIDS